MKPTKTRKITLRLDTSLLRAIDQHACARGLSRSAFLAEAAQAAMYHHQAATFSKTAFLQALDEIPAGPPDERDQLSPG